MWYVFEIQTDNEGSALVYSFADVQEARSKYFSILAVACKSSVKKHGAVLIDENGVNVEQPKFYVH